MEASCRSWEKKEAGCVEGGEISKRKTQIVLSGAANNTERKVDYYDVGV